MKELWGSFSFLVRLAFAARGVAYGAKEPFELDILSEVPDVPGGSIFAIQEYYSFQELPGGQGIKALTGATDTFWSRNSADRILQIFMKDTEHLQTLAEFHSFLKNSVDI